MRYFEKSEFACPCGCGQNFIEQAFLNQLDNARHIAGISFNINSGYRCLKHNFNIRGSISSSHLIGLAADIKCITDEERGLIIPALWEVGLNRIGIRKDFIHTDCDLTKNAKRIWVY